METRTVVWAKEGSSGVELAEVGLSASRLDARGVAIGSVPVPYRLDYTLTTRRGFITSRLRATTRGHGWRRVLDLRRSASGTWSVETRRLGDVPLPPPGGDATLLAGAVDCDLGLSPLTNSLPALRLGLLGDRREPATLTMAWISVPELAVRPDGQRYSPVGRGPNGHVLLYEAVDGSFTAEITFDDDGIVLEYPGIGRRAP